jgi:hypothetical protein
LPVIRRVVGDAVLACLAPLLAQGLQVADGSRATEVRSAMEERAGNATSSTYWRTQEMFLIQEVMNLVGKGGAGVDSFCDSVTSVLES